jgi:PAS domain S-box-containing protein
MGEVVTRSESTSLNGELRERLRFETLIADLSSLFVNLPAADMDREIMEAQRLFCELLGLDRAGFWQWSDEVGGSFKLTHLYRVEQGPEPPEPMIARDHFPWFEQQMLAGRTIAVSSMNELPAEAARDREVYGHFNIKSVLAVPLSVGGAAPLGILGFHTTRAERDWPDPLVKRLQLVAQIFANALARKRADEELREIADLNRATFDQAAVGIAPVGADDHWLRLNERLCAILGYPREERLRLTFQDITRAEDLAMDLDRARQVLSGEIKAYSTEKRYLRKDRSLVWAHLTVSLVRTKKLTPERLVLPKVR